MPTFVKAICETCNEEFTGQIGGTGKNPSFCSRECRAIGSRHLILTVTEKVCEQCGNVFSKRKTESVKVFLCKRFCSKECHDEHQRRKKPVEGWIYLDTKSGWTRVRRYFGNRCVICGWDEVNCDIAHIEPGKGNLIENLILLCPNHHRMYDRGKITLKEMLTIRRSFSSEYYASTAAD
jgi:hypothetical protein